jgi:hypothetical protein
VEAQHVSLLVAALEARQANPLNRNVNGLPQLRAFCLELHNATVSGAGVCPSTAEKLSLFIMDGGTPIATAKEELRSLTLGILGEVDELIARNTPMSPERFGPLLSLLRAVTLEYDKHRIQRTYGV